MFWRHSIDSRTLDIFHVIWMLKMWSEWVFLFTPINNVLNQRIDLAYRRPLILGIESSCDDTGSALMDATGRIYGDTLHSQQTVHLRYSSTNAHPPLIYHSWMSNKISKSLADTVELSCQWPRIYIVMSSKRTLPARLPKPIWPSMISMQLLWPHGLVCQCRCWLVCATQSISVESIRNRWFPSIICRRMHSPLASSTKLTIHFCVCSPAVATVCWHSWKAPLNSWFLARQLTMRRANALTKWRVSCSWKIYRNSPNVLVELPSNWPLAQPSIQIAMNFRCHWRETATASLAFPAWNRLPIGRLVIWGARKICIPIRLSHTMPIFAPASYVRSPRW